MKEGKDINEILNILVQKHFANFIKALQKKHFEDIGVQYLVSKKDE